MPRLKSTLPARPLQPMQIARTLYVLETRRRNLQIKRHVEVQKLKRIDAELAQIEAQMKNLSSPSAPSINPEFETEPPPPEEMDDSSFRLMY